MKSVLGYETVDYDRESHGLVIVDQTKLPGRVEFLSLCSPREIWDAIYHLKVRGAPAIGVAAAYGLAALGWRIKADSAADFMMQLAGHREYLCSARPTAVNLSWALNRVYRACESLLGQELDPAGDMQEEEKILRLRKVLLAEADRMKEEDIGICQRIGEHGLGLLKRGDGILTHCNAGQLATCRYGTATAPIYLGQERGYGFHVYADETRPLLQGARLTAFELQSAGVDVTLICDSMAASLMAGGKIQAVLVGCDRVAANGDTANKIGTSMLAVAASHYHVPFYVCAPLSTIDWDTATGKDIEIEERPGEEVTQMWFRQPMCPSGVKVYNPAFDVTDHSLIRGFVTELGVFSSPEEIPGQPCYYSRSM